MDPIFVLDRNSEDLWTNSFRMSLKLLYHLLSLTIGQTSGILWKLLHHHTSGLLGQAGVNICQKNSKCFQKKRNSSQKIVCKSDQFFRHTSFQLSLLFNWENLPKLKGSRTGLGKFVFKNKETLPVQERLSYWGKGFPAGRVLLMWKSSIIGNGWRVGKCFPLCQLTTKYGADSRFSSQNSL